MSRACLEPSRSWKRILISTSLGRPELGVMKTSYSSKHQLWGEKERCNGCTEESLPDDQNNGIIREPILGPCLGHYISVEFGCLGSGTRFSRSPQSGPQTCAWMRAVDWTGWSSKRLQTLRADENDISNIQILLNPFDHFVSYWETGHTSREWFESEFQLQVNSVAIQDALSLTPSSREKQHAEPVPRLVRPQVENSNNAKWLMFANVG